MYPNCELWYGKTSNRFVQIVNRMFDYKPSKVYFSNIFYPTAFIKGETHTYNKTIYSFKQISDLFLFSEEIYV